MSRRLRPRVEALESRLAPATFAVLNPNDAGADSLRQAILDANANPGADTITFAIGAVGSIQTINVGSTTGLPLPGIVDTVTLDGWSQGGVGYEGPPLIELNGTAAGANANGLVVNAANSVVRGFVINRFTASGITVNGSNGIIVGNYVGTNVAGDQDLGNGGIGVVLNSNTNQLGGADPSEQNIISGNDQQGVVVNGGSNSIQGNFIGLGVDGDTALGNSDNGLVIQGATGSFNLVGGTVPAACNVISANGANGVLIQLGATGNRVEGNCIGTDASGFLDRGNGTNGVFISNAGGNTVGGSALGAGNVISGNGANGVAILGADSVANRVLGNLIGLDDSGGTALGNTLSGVHLGGSASANVIGGTSGAEANVISGNDQDGLRIIGGATLNVVRGNFIGTDFTGIVDVGNTGTGVRILAATDNVVGGTAAGAGNVISGNGASGVEITGPAATGNRVQGNRIGTDVNGTADLGNTQDGVLIQDAPANLVGGLTAGAGNVVSGNDRIGVSIIGASAVGNVIQGNILGLDVNGDGLISNTFSGVSVEDSPGTVIGGITAGARNVISGNGTNGIFITAAAAGIGGSSVIQGNYIGLDITGELPRGNGDNGILIIVASNNTIGGAAAGAGNVISSNVNIQANEGGLSISQSHNNVVQGNLIGLDKDGTTNLGNGSNGIILGTGSTNNVIGGAAAGAGNTIAGNGFGPAGPGAGILLIDFGGPVATANNAILGNRIGTTLDGTTAIGNMLGGVVVFEGPTNNVIGGPLPGQGNLISGSVGVGGATPFGDGVILRNASGNQVFGNRIGTNAAGTAARANVGSGVLLDNADNSLIQGNLISGNGQDGVSVTNGSDGNVIRGNLVGTDVTGASDLGNTRDGVRIDASLNNTVGGTETGQGNVLSGNGAMGLLIDGQTSAATGNVVQGNIIGLASNGLAAIGNDLLGVDILSASGNTVGGTTAGARNVISSNHAGGMFVGLPLGVLVGSASNNTIQGNYIGLDVSGAVPRGNEQEGIVVSNGANNVIRDNIIANNLATGIAVAGPLATGNTIQGNAIGTAADRTTPHGNFGDGVHFDLNASNNLVGGTTAGTGNLIAFNSNAGFSGGNGVAVLSGNGNSILGNSIFDNALLGIALSPGANDNQAAPVLTSAVIAGGQVTVTGTVGGVAGHVFRIEIFGNAAGGNEGQTFLGFVDATANGAGVASFTVTLPLPAGLTVITATATDQTTDSTSAFSPGTPVTQPVPPTPPAPVPVVYFAATGTGRQSSVVTIFDARTGQVVFSFRPYGPRFRGRVRVAVGDVNGDGVPDIVVGPGPGANRPVLVFDGRNLALLFRFAVGGRRQTGGVTLAVGDLNRDGKGDVVVGTGPGSPGGVVAFSGADGRVLLSSLPFGRRYLRGVRVAVADVNGDGLSEVLAEGTISGRPVVRIVG